MDLLILIGIAFLAILWLPVIFVRKHTDKKLFTVKTIALMLAQPLLVAVLLFLFETFGLGNPMGLLTGTTLSVSIGGLLLAKQL